jgi:hypothetical protein
LQGPFGGPLPWGQRQISGIAVPQDGSGTVYVIIGATAAFGSSHQIYRSTDYGVTWTDISANLPIVPVNTILLYKSLSGTYIPFVGTDNGVYIGATDGAGNYTWTRFNPDMPNVQVLQLTGQQYAGGFEIAAATHGLGVWTTILPPGFAGLKYTTTTLTSSRNPALAGQAITFTAQVRGFEPPSNLPVTLQGGTVVFYDTFTNATGQLVYKQIGTATVNSLGMATLTINGLAPGLHQVTAWFSGTGDYAASSSSRVFQNVLVPQPGANAVFLPPVLAATVGGDITVPVSMFIGSNGGESLQQADVAIAYDPSEFSLTGVALGQLIESGFHLAVDDTSEPGEILLSAVSNGPPLQVDSGTTGDLFELTFSVNSTASIGLSVLNLQADFARSSGLFQTALYDADDQKVALAPAPTDGSSDPVDATVAV